MGGRSTMLVVKNGEIAEIRIRKPQAPRTLRAWTERAATAAIWEAQSELCAIRLGNTWHIIDGGKRAAVRKFKRDQQAAAEMWLLHRGRK